MSTLARRDGQRTRLSSACASACVFAWACAVGPDYVRPEPPADVRYTWGRTEGVSASRDVSGQTIRSSNDLAADWWRLLRCPELDGLVAEAIVNNPNLRQAEATLHRAQHSLKAGYGVFLPEVDANAGFTRRRFTPAVIGLPQPPSTFNLFTLSSTVTYSLDIWGGNRRALEALKAEVEAQRHAVIGAFVVLSGNVVNTVVATAAYREEARIVSQLILIQLEQVRIAEAQVVAGTRAYADVLGLRGQLAALRGRMPPLLRSAEQSSHLLATLLGRTPAERPPPDIELADLRLPSDIPMSLPARLVRQRPDILVAEARLRAANAQIGVATAALLPNLTLSGDVGVNNPSAAELFTSRSLFWSVGAGLTQPVFRAGTLWYERKAAIDA